MGLQDSDIILVEREDSGTSGTSTLYRETYGNRGNIGSSDLLLVERGGTLYRCTYADWSSANSTDLILVEADSTINGRVDGKLYKETKANWFPSSYADIHSANYMVTLGTLLYNEGDDSDNNFSVVEVQVEVSSSASSAEGNLFIGFRNSASTDYWGDFPIAAIQILHADGTTFRVTDEFLMDFNFGMVGNNNPNYPLQNGYCYWTTTYNDDPFTITNANTHPNTYYYAVIDDSRTKREFSVTTEGTVSNHVGAKYGISASTYNSNGNTVLAVGNQNIPQDIYNSSTNPDPNGYIFSECSGSDEGDLTWLMLVGTGHINNGDRIRICYYGGGNGQTSSGGLQTTNSLYLRFEEDPW